MMRAKLKITSVQKHENVAQETLTFAAVAKSGGYPADGADEDNTFAKFTPSASLTMQILNPALLGQFKEGQAFYVDFTPVPEAEPAA